MESNKRSRQQPTPTASLLSQDHEEACQSLYQKITNNQHAFINFDQEVHEGIFSLVFINLSINVNDSQVNLHITASDRSTIGYETRVALERILLSVNKLRDISQTHFSSPDILKFRVWQETTSGRTKYGVRLMPRRFVIYKYRRIFEDSFCKISENLAYTLIEFVERVKDRLEHIASNPDVEIASEPNSVKNVLNHLFQRSVFNRQDIPVIIQHLTEMLAHNQE